MILQVAAQHLPGGGAAEVEGGRRRHRARVGGEQIAAGRQHVGAATRRRAGRTSSDVAAVERCDQRAALGSGALAANCVRLVIGGAAIDMQAILDGEILEIAEPGIDAAQRLVRRVGFRHAGFGGEAGLGGSFDDQFCEAVAAATIEAVGLRVFVDQPLQLLLVFVKTGIRQRRRQMTEGDGRDSPLGLRCFARVRYDERIDDGQEAGDNFGEAGAAQGDRLARQPFQRAVRSDMDDGVDAERFAQP